VVNGIIRFIADLPQRGIIQPVVIYPAGFKAQGTGTDLVLCDKHGHARTGYAAPVDSVHCVVVLPDGMAGAIVSGVPGLKKYFDIIFHFRSKFNPDLYHKIHKMIFTRELSRVSLAVWSQGMRK
jgi:hypothetical protein